MIRFPLLGLALGLSICSLFQPALGQVAPAGTIKPAPSTAADAPAAPIDWDRARRLFQLSKSGGKLSPEDAAYLQRAMEARRQGGGGQPPRGDSRALFGRAHIDFKPLDEMSAEDRYSGEEGGLYGEGRNAPTDEHRRAAESALAQVRPLDAAGKPAEDGTIGFISISMSNATQEFSTFKRIADEDPAKSPRVTIVDCAQGGQAMAEWVSPNGNPWRETARRLDAAGITPAQVQVVWVKLANKSPQGTLEQHGGKLASDTIAVLHNVREKFPQVRIAYLGSRIYGGHASGGLNPEPFAYEGAFVVRRLIRDQIAGKAELNYDAARGAVQSPLLLWGPYLWADGDRPRKSDGLAWLAEDFSGDGVHPSTSGREKVARLMLKFLTTDPLAKPWFAAKP